MTVALACCMATTPRATAQERTSVVAQDLNSARASGKLAAVLWTRRADVCTLQLVINWRGSMLPVTAKRPSLPQIQVWLLKADGSTVPWSRVIYPDMKNVSVRTNAVDLMYRYPLSASQDAVAAAIMIDDQYFIEQLKLKE
jgi:hypothetical protein